MKTFILVCLFGAIALSGCVWGHIERSQTLIEENASSLVGKEATVTLANSTMREEGTILDIAKDSLLLSVMQSSRRKVALANINDIFVEGSVWGKIGGGLVLGAIGGALGASATTSGGMFASLARTSNGVGGALLGAVVGGLLGEALFTPDWKYIVTPGRSVLPTDSDIQETQQWSGANPQYVLIVKQLLEETVSTVTIPWQGKTVKLPKSEIIIEKHEKGYQITVPAQLLM